MIVDRDQKNMDLFRFSLDGRLSEKIMNLPFKAEKNVTYLTGMYVLCKMK